MNIRESFLHFRELYFLLRHDDYKIINESGCYFKNCNKPQQRCCFYQLFYAVIREFLLAFYQLSGCLVCSVVMCGASRQSCNVKHTPKTTHKRRPNFQNKKKTLFLTTMP